MAPETRYAKLGDRHVAYQVVGEGPVDLLVATAPFLLIDLMWDEPSLVRVLERLSSYSRSIWWDNWGRGASDRLPPFEMRLLESVVDEMVCLLDTVRCQKTAVVDFAGGWVGELFAATHPERTSALVLDSPTACLRQGRDYPQGLSQDEIERRLSRIREEWGTGAAADFLAPSMGGDARLRRWLGRCERLTTTPDETIRRLRHWYDADLRHVLSTIRAPTLVIVRPGHRLTAQSQFVAEHIDGARVIEATSDPLFFAGDTAPMLDAIEEFLTGRLPVHGVDRVLATLVFTDVVGSTEHAARLGDRRWREVLAAHDRLVREELERHRGREVKSMGDGFLATFDGPGRAVRCASAIRDTVRGLGIEVRVGVHTGEIELRDDDVHGIAVHIAQRVMAEAASGEVVASSTVRDLVAGSGIIFDDRGVKELRGIPDPWRLFVATV